MAQKLIAIDDARALVLERARPLGGEPTPVTAALGRVLAEDVTAADSVPGFDGSAMDGYALRGADTRSAADGDPARLEVVGESRAGHPSDRELGPGEAIKISTGAMIPAGADAVIRVEDTDDGDERVAVRVAVEPGNDIRRAGEDIEAGERVLRTGVELGPAEIGVLASVGRGEVACAIRPWVTVLTTGDELQEPGPPLRPGGIRNSNAHSLAGLVERSGALLRTAEIVPDDRVATTAALERAIAGELTVVSGGVSVGQHDHVRPALANLGVEEVFWGVALRPGKPTYFGTTPAGGLVFGLPGNPVSAIVTFTLFVRPAIRRLLGAADPDPRRATAILDERYPKPPGRAHLIRCTLELRDDGWHATPTKDQSSHVLTSMLGADALAVAPTESGDVEVGDRLEIELLR